MRNLSSSLLMAMLAVLVLTGNPSAAHAADANEAATAAGGGIAAHIAKFDFADEWGENVDWSKLDPLIRALAPDKLDWNALCLKAAGKQISDFPDGLPEPDAERFVAVLADRLKEIASAGHVELTQNDWAIMACAVLPMQAVKGAGQKYVTTLGDTSRLGTAIVKLVRTGVNCGDGCVLTAALLRALNIECRFVGCHRKVSLPNQPAGHAMIEYFESDPRGRRFGHIVDATNLSTLKVGGEPIFRPPVARFQIAGDRLARLQFLVASSFLHEQPGQQSFDPPFSKEELGSRELAAFVSARWDARLDARCVVLDSTRLEATVPDGMSLMYRITVGKDIPDGATPIVRMYRKGPDGGFLPLGSFSLHRTADSKEVRLVWDRIQDGLTPGDYRADFYIDDGSFGYGYRRGGQYAGEQTIRYATRSSAVQ